LRRRLITLRMALSTAPLPMGGLCSLKTCASPFQYDTWIILIRIVSLFIV
jgi:hypothetical protein